MADNLIRDSSDDLVWSDLLDYASPFVAVGKALLDVISPAGADPAALAQRILQKLDDLSLQIKQLQVAIQDRLAEETVRERSGEVLGIKEVIDEFTHIHDRALLDNMITSSAVTKGKIVVYLRAPDTSITYFHTYNTLFATLVPLRVSCFGLLQPPQHDLAGLVCGEIKDLLEFRERGIAVARAIGANRVSPVKENVVLVDEVGPVYGTDFAINVDGKAVYTNHFWGARESPARHISDIRAQADAARQRLVDQYADMGSAELNQLYAASDAVQAVVCT